MKNLCSILIPRHDALFAKEISPCIRRRGHGEPHLIKRSDDSYVAWEQDWECKDCEPFEECECFVHREVAEDEAMSMLRQDGFKTY